MIYACDIGHKAYITNTDYLNQCFNLLLTILFNDSKGSNRYFLFLTVGSKSFIPLDISLTESINNFTRL